MKMKLSKFVEEWNESVDRNEKLPLDGNLSDQVLLYLEKCMRQSMVFNTGHLFDISLSNNGRITLSKEELDKIKIIY